MAPTSTTLDRLRRAVRAHDDPAAAGLDDLVAGRRASVRIEVTGRAGVGRTALVAALGPFAGAGVVETDAWDRPGARDPELVGDVVVLALLDPPRTADRAAATAAGDRLVPVLVRADTLADPSRAAERVTAVLGVPCVPVTAVGAVTGLAAARAAIAARVDAVRSRRAALLLARVHALARIPALRDPVEEFVASDDGVWLAADAAVPDVAGDAVARARYWRAAVSTATDAAAARDALARQRAAVREWARRG
ncbi:hypothetical protein GCM10023094_33170 [Rhodococcus olei]|uniref:Uncharacterized protein n=1 Tax=Rhodococcus olei TaxID=2161675 RepID=A0ABP8P7I2_9NOCA